jgi:transcription termination factor Rho
MSVMDRSALDASPLADLHAIASELSIDGYRRLRRAELIDAILDKQAGVEAPPDESDQARETEDRAREAEDQARETEDQARETEDRARETEDRAREAEDRARETEDQASAPDEHAGEPDDEEERAPRRRRGRRGGRGRNASRGEGSESDDDEAEHEDEGESGDEPLVEGVVELLANGSGFVRVQPPDASDDDVYISSAQVKRCELVSGDRITGPKRAPRRSERFASLIRVETINGRPASELADSVRFDDLPAAFATEQLTLGSEDVTLKAIDWLTPFGKGSRVAIVGEARSGKSHTLKRIALALADRDDLAVQVVLAGVRPEELTEWNQSGLPPVAALSFAASEDAQNGAIEPVVDQARRLAARGSDAVVLIDSLDGCSPQLARKALASARNIVDGGSLTVIAASTDPIGGETTMIALDHELTAVGRFPAIDLFTSGTLHPELLVGEEGAATIARTRAEALEIASE